ncbi:MULTISPECIES: 2-oxo-4-hydroxy-4-carboxy-5-ureidoimidazoline decarboxylase [unclassified Undibacterium]|uniref:2-oxo-4-hydroxy-4-carboxy-5-ureidoimidazoline decarboxylase n=1 Tax=unclassified Undibacterium TaxID=2630295 RepID=UPI002AC90F88|nr:MULTISPECIES: 2-oxo-4-hydroxy-4-carboxy-5-ureidoimidazoline decarboxylase [unclassified Undibacterium]MEB0140783.1 2-oxo-4-hydroxy-4-carboxy-5-ureidoimidazoline decarboxylase [Undibacterium sp. CCC2.1]MEB0173757.1 2-oxo-4-hydroxy-4-carboxy-5-ureidoimidazoline decarboxylase [Undibacterium sp. CCC1.1]MEB0177766.1 2-oxo-4-hydroxy-4-carboxy-5-ureidoimidazoline decarboxylase [Undibacterium sp. CCC3.4]MEB0216966.1 2-oxo-4-hydroxy-4-carboxy-5-ureidoimidazoline decarboxylase [Undibacterium sp. 5I2]
MMATAVQLTWLNACSRDEFVASLADIFEHSPWLAAAVAGQRPFASVAQLHAAMAEALRTAGETAQLALIRAHPELAGKAALRGELTAASSSEQSGVGLDQCSREEYEQLHALNAAYQQKFTFPFILAVRGHDRASIIANFARRIEASPASEMAACIEQIIAIAGFRLADKIAESS